ncbi:MAG: hypothetical protein EZS28_020961 [Streblomastix strix]|uniref:Uncharacterized protein n=1 Tax=Streblomastix strix TaxID=222440 RepID=A0A5J4VLQ6_9EUKA|nr:MAG: hypothetical protein EZS28_020961 [Streblomastix strix]
MMQLNGQVELFLPPLEYMPINQHFIQGNTQQQQQTQTGRIPKIINEQDLDSIFPQLSYVAVPASPLLNEGVIYKQGANDNDKEFYTGKYNQPTPVVITAIGRNLPKPVAQLLQRVISYREKAPFLRLRQAQHNLSTLIRWGRLNFTISNDGSVNIESAIQKFDKDTDNISTTSKSSTSSQRKKQIINQEMKIDQLNQGYAPLSDRSNLSQLAPGGGASLFGVAIQGQTLIAENQNLHSVETLI